MVGRGVVCRVVCKPGCGCVPTGESGQNSEFPVPYEELPLTR